MQLNDNVLTTVIRQDLVGMLDDCVAWHFESIIHIFIWVFDNIYFVFAVSIDVKKNISYTKDKVLNIFLDET